MKGLELKGRVFQIMEPLSGESSKGPWTKREFVIETMDQYPKKVCFEVWKDKVEIPKVGEIATVHFNAESREYSSRWYTSLSAWKLELSNEQVGQATPPQPQQQQPEQPTESPLPF